MTSEKLKGKIKSFSEKNNLKAQEVLQMYFFPAAVSQRFTVLQVPSTLCPRAEHPLQGG